MDISGLTINSNDKSDLMMLKEFISKTDEKITEVG